MYNLQNAKNILITHLEGMGDNILSIPLLHNIRALNQSARLDVLIPKGRSDIYHNQKLDGIFEAATIPLPRRVLDTPYDIIFDLSTSYSLCPYVYYLKYDLRICFRQWREFENDLSLPWSPDVPAWQQMLNLLTLINFKPPYRQDYSFQVSEANLKFARFLRAGIGHKQMICIVPGAGGMDNKMENKRWSPRRFAQLIGYLHKTFSCHIVILGHYTESSLGDRIGKMLSCEVTNLMGMTSIGTLAGLLREARLVISNDTGTMHLAGILNTPIVALFGPSNYREYGPLGDNHKIIVSDTKEMSGISVDQVIGACDEMLTEVG